MKYVEFFLLVKFSRYFLRIFYRLGFIVLYCDQFDKVKDLYSRLRYSLEFVFYCYGDGEYRIELVKVYNQFCSLEKLWQ